MRSLLRLARAAIALALAAIPIALASQSTHPGAGETPVRLHHVHYRVADPAQTMTTVARAVDGVRVVARGFGVGVRTAGELILFDRPGEEKSDAARPIANLYPAILDRLRQWGMSPQPESVNQLHAAAALPHESVDHVGFSVPDVRAARDRAIEGGARVVSERDDAVLVDAGAGLLIELLRDTEREETFWCPMHPDIRSADPLKCPLCGMDLVPIPPPRIGEYHLDVDLDRVVQTGVIRGIRLAVREPGSDALVRELLPVHEATLHLFVVSRDLTFFDHLHPDRMSDGTYRLQRELPAGEYMLIADFLPAGGTTQMVQRAVISGRPAAVGNAPSTDTELARTRTVGGLTVALEAGTGSAGKEFPLTFRLSDAATGAAVTDLQPYLGAPAHMLLVRTDLSDAIHAHPEEVVTAGPTVTFHPLLPSVGDYRLWIQFKRDGRVLTFPFALRATP